MSTERELEEILAEIGLEHRAIGAPDKLESVLCAATAARISVKAAPRMRLAFTLAAVVILLAALAGVAVLWQTHIGHPSQIQQARSASPVQRTPQAIDPLTNRTQTHNLPAKPAQVRNIQKHDATPRHAPSPHRTWNSLDEFVPLPASEGLPTAAELSVVRIKLRGSDLQQYGLQTPADAAGQTMLAEFVVGEDGLPRAIRIVR